MYTAYLTFGDSFRDVYFPDQRNWNSKIVLREEETGWNCDVHIAVRRLDGQVYIAPEAPLLWRDGTRTEHVVKDEPSYNMVEENSGRGLMVIIKECQRKSLSFNKYAIPRRNLVIGRSERADIRDTNVLMSAEHGVISMMEQGYVRYQDQSSNGTYLNGRKLLGNSARLKFGDVLAFLTGLKIVYLGDCIAVNSAASAVALEHWKRRRPAERRANDGREAPSVYREFQRPPRMLMRSRAEDVEIEPPIPRPNQNQQPLFLQLGPSMTMVLPMLMGTVIAGSGRGMISSGLVMISTSSALAVTWGLLNRRHRLKQERSAEARRVDMYQQYIEEIEAKLQRMNEDERRRLLDTFPNAAQCAAMPGEMSRNLWNRMPAHPDFLCVRIGTGEVEMPCEIKVPAQKISTIDDELRSEPDRLKASYAIMKGAPVTLELRGESVIGILGGMGAMLFAQGLLMQIAALHSYHDVRIAVLTRSSDASQWAWARWLPHVFTSEDRDLRMVASVAGDIHDVVAHLDEVYNQRKNNADARVAADEEDDGASPLPHYVVFCNDSDIFEAEPSMRRLLTNRLGMTLVIIGEEMSSLPKECRVVLNMQTSEGYMHSREGDSRKVDFEYPERSLIRGFSRAMAPMRVRDVAEAAAIPSLVSFLDVYGARRVEDLEVWRMWTENHTYEGLKSTIGYKAGGQPFVLDISDKYHGPHGLIAGTTGSGKSVMLETYILSLALNYSPKQVQFILIDYKGGGMSDSFKSLPHVVGIIDNLQGSRVIGRALASLKGEIKRREHIFKQAEVNNINDYARLYGEEPGMELPHLIIIVDEFAELKGDQPEFMRELVSASRVGRSLGIHLILSTQKPSGSVSDEIWANARFHLCLRVQTRQDSMDMLKRADAAYIKGMGRCFIQIGNDELFEQVQTSYSGLEYRPDEPRPEELPQLLTHTAHVVRTGKKRRAEDEGEKPTQMKAVLARIREVAAAHEMEKQRRLWLPELPENLYLYGLRTFRRPSDDGKSYPNPQGNIRLLAGLADDVDNQLYLPYVVDLTEARNLIVVGLAGTGKTTLVQSMVYSLCNTYDPSRLNIYILSLTSQTLGNLVSFPQVGDVVFDGEKAEARRLLNMLEAELERRAELFAAASTDSFQAYNAARLKRGAAPEPAIVVFVDRCAQLFELFAGDEPNLERIKTLFQEGSGRGIHFVLTAMAMNELPSRLRIFFSGAALQLKDRADYSECINHRVPYDMQAIANLPGRGMGVIDNKVYEIQFALGGDAPIHEGEGFDSFENSRMYDDVVKQEQDAPEVAPSSDVERAEKIVHCARGQDAAWTGSRPARVPRIPKEPDWQTLFAEPDFEAQVRTDFGLPLGYDMERGGVASIETSGAPGWMVFGPPRSGVSNFLKLMARVMKARGADVHVVANAGWTQIAAELSLSLHDTPDKVEALLKELIENCARPRKALRDAALQAGRAEARRQEAMFKQCCILVDNAEWVGGLFSAPEQFSKRQMLEGLMGEIATKPYYNLLVFMGMTARESVVQHREPYKTLAAQGRCIALGGKLSDFDPCGVGAGMNLSARAAAWPIGLGLVSDGKRTFRFVAPLAEREED